MNIRFVMLFYCFLLTLTPCASQKKLVKTTLQTRIDSLYTAQFPNPEEPGGSVLIKKGDQIVYLNNFGVADIETGEKITEHTLFNTGSISKTFVANGILLLQQQRLLSIENPIAMYFKDFTNKEIANSIQIKHWLSHTSGIPDVRKIAENKEFYLTAKDTQNFAPLKKVDSLLFEPGERFRYSNPAYNGLALIIEQVTQAPWQNFIYEHILHPSGMMTTTIQDGSHPKEGVAHGYILKDGAYHEQDYGEEPTFAASGNSGVWSSVMELAKYEKAIQSHVFLSEDLINQSRIVWKPENWKSKTNPYIGYSWFIEKEYFMRKPVSFDVTFINHTGSNGGYNSFYIFIPEKDILLVGLFNQPLKGYHDLVLTTISILQEEGWGSFG